MEEVQSNPGITVALNSGSIRAVIKRVEILKARSNTGSVLIGYDARDLPKYIIKSGQTKQDDSILHKEFTLSIWGFNPLNHSSFSKVHSIFYANPIIFEDAITPRKALLLQDAVDKHTVLSQLCSVPMINKGFTEDVQLHQKLYDLYSQIRNLENEYQRVVSNIQYEMTSYKHVKEWGGSSNNLQSLYVVYNYIPGVTLERFLVDASLNDIYYVWVCLLHTLNFMHKCGLSHGDISRKNIIIKPCTEGYVEYQDKKIYTSYQPVLINYSNGGIDAIEEMMNHDVEMAMDAFLLSGKTMTSKHLTMLKSWSDAQEILNIKDPSCFIINILKIVNPNMLTLLSDEKVSRCDLNNDQIIPMSSDDLIKATEDIHFEVTCNHDYDTLIMETAIEVAKRQSCDYVFYECSKCLEKMFEYPNICKCRKCHKYICSQCQLVESGMF